MPCCEPNTNKPYARGRKNFYLVECDWPKLNEPETKLNKPDTEQNQKQRQECAPIQNAQSQLHVVQELSGAES